jgi:hypothetical protein
MINQSTWPVIVTHVLPKLQEQGVLRPQVHRRVFQGPGGGYLFLVYFYGVKDITNNVTRPMEIHFHTDEAMKKAGEISVKWSIDDDELNGGAQKHRLKKGPNNRPLANLTTVDFKDDENTAKVIDYIVTRIKNSDFKII